jgi:hypothetical protein
MNVSLAPDVRTRMNVGEFLAWSERHPEPEDLRYELVDGKVVAVSRLETIGHNQAKAAAGFKLHDAVRAAGLTSVVLFKGMGDTRIMKDGDIVLDPPGLSISVAAFLGEED